MNWSRRHVRANGVRLCVETFGDASDPPILLIMGAAASMDWWEHEFCSRLAAGRRFVIRYDHRDTGQSVTYPPRSPEYSGADLVTDAVGILDALDASPAHLAGMSMGGALAQLLALDHPDRVRSLILISTGPATPGADDGDLPSMSPEAAARFADLAEPNWADRAAVLDYGVRLSRACAGTAGFDEAAARALWERALDRTIDIEAMMTNHHVIDGAEPWRHRLGELRAPTLVIHGTADPVIPYGHGEALADEIPGARLLALEAVGHEIPRSTWDTVVPAMIEHTD